MKYNLRKIFFLSFIYIFQSGYTYIQIGNPVLMNPQSNNWLSKAKPPLGSSAETPVATCLSHLEVISPAPVDIKIGGAKTSILELHFYRDFLEECALVDVITELWTMIKYMLFQIHFKIISTSFVEREHPSLKSVTLIAPSPFYWGLTDNSQVWVLFAYFELIFHKSLAFFSIEIYLLIFWLLTHSLHICVLFMSAGLHSFLHLWWFLWIYAFSASLNY